MTRPVGTLRMMVLLPITVLLVGPLLAVTPIDDEFTVYPFAPTAPLDDRA